ncbi:MAG TPA: benzoate-CoA ligase family protein [Thermoanaerobaculia bacterium]|nr:benzoate-CoA ligase family protein [Thermoanaerobaculia bacterium]
MAEPPTHILEPSAHLDTFCRDSLPPPELWPRMIFSDVPELAYPPRLNCVTELLDARIDAGDGERTAIVFPGGSWSYRELQANVNRVAHVLIEDLGLIPGNRVLLRGLSTPMLAACWLAVAKAGGVVVCTMPMLRMRELTYIADKAQIRLALTDARIATECEQAMRTKADGSPREGARVVHFQGDGGEGSLEALMRNKPADFSACDTAADDVALILFTSGTTGQAKGTLHFHRDALAVSDCFARYVLKPTADDLFCGSPSLAFAYGVGGLLFSPLRFGASVLLIEQATPANLLQGIQDYRATICYTVPTAYRAMSALAGDYDLTSLRRCISAGETLPVATFEAWRKATGIEILDGIGSTEMLHQFISASDGEIKPGSTGKAVPGYEAKVVDDNGDEVAAGVIGRLAVCGPTGCRYLADPERQRHYVQHGWNLTGDAYVRDAEGFFWYQARTDDMIISSGHNIAGPEVESVLLQHPKVRECGVVGVPDEVRGQVVKAFVILNPGVEPGVETVKELQDHVKLHIAPYKYPRKIEFVDTLPRTETGKLQRFKLRQGG